MKLQSNQLFTVSITPLTPIHIGCVVDYEPTDTLIYEKNLYAMQHLSQWQGGNSENLAYSLKNATDIDSVQAAFTRFNDKANDLSALATRPVTMPFANPWNNYVKGKIKAIERTAFNALSNQAIITGSALKGAFRTAYIEQFGEQGTFDADPLRQLKISDSRIVEPAQQPLTAVYQRQTRHTKDMSTTSVPDSGQNFAEAILPAQKHAFSCNIDIHSVANLYRVKLAALTISELFRCVNQHTIASIQTALSQPEPCSMELPLNVWWAKHRLAIQALIERGAVLIRLGRHVGAVQLSCERGREITTKHKTGYPISSTVAYSGGTQSPFGFALLIPETAHAACEPLLDTLLKNMPHETDVLNKARDHFKAHLAHREAKQIQWKIDVSNKAQAIKDQAELKAKQAIAEQEKLEKAAKQTPQQNAIDTLINHATERCETLKGKKDKKTDVSYSWFSRLIQQAVSESWHDSDKTALAAAVVKHLPTIVSGFMQDDKDGRKAMKTLLAPLNLPVA